MTRDFVIERLSRGHQRSGFTCGVPALDRYIRAYAGQDDRKHVARCFVAAREGDQTVAGYYTLSATNVPSDAIDESKRRRLPLYPYLPAALVGRLAVDGRFQGLGLGATMIVDAARRAMRSDAACYALVVEAKDERSAAFYRRHQFEAFVGESLRLYLPLETMKHLFP